MSIATNISKSAVKKKVLIAFIVAGGALAFAWAVSRGAFSQMLTTVQQMTEPDPKLGLLNTLFRDVTLLDQEQRSKAFQTGFYSGAVVWSKSASLFKLMDSLSVLYNGDKLQLRRIEDMKRLLSERDSLFLGYLKVREGLVTGREMKRQLKSLSSLIGKSSEDIDTTVITTQQKFSTTTVQPKVVGEEQKEGGLLKRIFGKRKNVIDTQKVIMEELKVTVDTVAQAKSDSVIKQMERTVSNIGKRQVSRTLNFIYQEIQLSNSSNILINKILTILQQVEREAIEQKDINNNRTAEVVASSIRTLEYIMIAFILFAAVLAYLILTDISKSNRYREELEYARDEAEFHSQAKQRFLSNMSHEIRTPLQSIIGYAEQMRQEQGKEEESEAIYQSSLHLLHLVNDVLDYSKISSGKLRFNRQPFDVAGLIEEVRLIMALQAKNKQLDFVVDAELNEIGVVIGDAYRLKQILYNLLGNALKFTDTGHVGLKVRCKTIKRRSFFSFEVFDSGRGIDQEDIRRIFNEFEQSHVSDSSLSAGTGLGLSIVKALVEGQGGSIDIESEPGLGSRFIVKMRYLVPKSSRKKDKLVAPVVLDNAASVWLIDDDTSILHLGSVILKKTGVPFTTFADPLIAKDAIVPDGLTHILMDVRMPGISGLELCKWMRQKLGNEVKIFALTAQVLPGEHDKIMEAGFDGILAKPFREAEFLGLLKKGYSQPANTRVSKIDHAALLKLVMGDEDTLKRILAQFTLDSKADSLQLKEALSQDNREMVSLILHRIAGRVAQMGNHALAERFKEEEYYVLDGGFWDDDFRQRVAIYLEDLALSLENEITE